METGSTPPGSDPGQQGGPAPGGQQAPPTAPPGPPGQPVPQQAVTPAPLGPGGVPLADYLPRVGALLLDGLIVGIAWGIVYGVLVAVGLGSGSGTAFFVTWLVGFLAYIPMQAAYTILTMNRPGERNGQTLGKQVLDIRVIQETGEPMNTGKIVIREVVFRGGLVLLSSLTFGVLGLVLLLDYLWPLWDDERRALHDMVAKTRVVRA